MAPLACGHVLSDQGVQNHIIIQREVSWTSNICCETSLTLATLHCPNTSCGSLFKSGGAAEIHDFSLGAFTHFLSPPSSQHLRSRCCSILSLPKEVERDVIQSGPKLLSLQGDLCGHKRINIKFIVIPHVCPFLLATPLISQTCFWCMGSRNTSTIWQEC
jgi:hypothetical protein